MRSVGELSTLALCLGLAVAAPLASARAQEGTTGPLILTPSPAVTAAITPPVPAAPAADPATTVAPPVPDTDEPRTTGIDDDPVPPAPIATPAVAAPVLPAGASLETALGFDPLRLGATPIARVDVERFYAAAGLAPLWTGNGRLAAQVPALTAIFADAGAEGLDVAAFPLATLSALQAEGATGSFEVLFTDTLIRYAAERAGARLASVRLPVDMREVGAPVDGPALAAAVVASADPVAALQTVGPQDAGYLALKRLLADYRAIAAAGGWAAVPSDGPKIEPGNYDARIPAIRARLSVTDGAPTESAHPNHYDAALEAAVKRFQTRHGLKSDGVIGKLTFEHMSKPVEYRIRQILVNMERKRQRLDDLGPNRIIVNIPEFTLRYWEDGVIAFETPVVIGRQERKTPLLQSKVTNVVLNPPWSVPARNAGEDIVRKQINDPNYLTAHGYTVYFNGEPVDPTSIDWTQVPRSRSIPYRLRQAPGDGNSLGRLKINFKNDYAVYLHDTPDKHLFARDYRALSSGCVRVRDPLALGARLLRDVPGWSRERIDTTLASSTTTLFINVKHDIGVRLTYVTAWVDADGTVEFRQDLYGIDSRIDKGLGRPAMLASGL